MLKIPDFQTKKEVYDWIVSNKSQLFQSKTTELKHSDCISAAIPVAKAVNNKAENTVDKDEILVTAVINTTNFLDSYGDVHIKGLWDQSLKENKMIMHIQEHKMEFDKIISDGDDLKAYTKTYNWKDIGYDYKGTTEALVFESNVKKSRNAAMFHQYSNGFVKNHSVGMRYMDYQVAINDPDFKEEYANWNKYYPDIANKDTANALGYFFAITEAKVIEGSAVPLGANPLTPTISVKNIEKGDEILEEEKIDNKNSSASTDIYKKYKTAIREQRITILRLT